MTTYGPARLVAGDTEPAEHLGWNGIPFMMRRTFGEHLEFAHIFNTVTPSAYPSDSTLSSADKTQGDHSWNGRHATRLGAAPDSSKFTCGASAYYRTPLTGDELWAIAGEMTLLAVANVPNNYAMLIGNYNGNATHGFGLGRQLTGGGNYDFGAWYASETDTFAQLSDNTWTGTGLELIAATVTSDLKVKVYGWNPLTHAIRTISEVTLPAAPGGTGLLRIGRSIETNYTSAADIAGAWAFSKAFDVADMPLLFDDLQAFMSSQGITILW